MSELLFGWWVGGWVSEWGMALLWHSPALLTHTRTLAHNSH